MRKYLIIHIIFSLFYLTVSPLCFANEINKVKLTAEKVDKSALIGEVDKLVLKKYIAVRLDISNKNSREISLPYNVYYVYRGISYKIPSNALIYQKAKRHTVLRGIITFPLVICILGAVVFIGTITYSSTSNGTLEDNIKKNTFKPKHLFEDDYYSTFVFIPKKHKKATEIIIKNVSDGDNTFDLESNIISNI